jgi:hypothetical protein
VSLRIVPLKHVLETRFLRLAPIAGLGLLLAGSLRVQT